MDLTNGTIIVLVHGTFAKNAAWTRPTSKLFRGVTNIIPGEKSITAFSWSGWNSPTARYKAAEQLRAELKRSAAEHPSWNIVVIGHSHGGTVAMRAVDCDELRRRAALVCLSTPFLHALPRNLPKGVLVQLGAAVSMVIAAAINPGWPFSRFLHIPQLIFPDYLDFVAGRINSLIFLGIGAGVFWVLSALAEKADTVATQVMHVPMLYPSNVLLLRVAGDEASSWISVFQVMSWISSKVSRIYAAAASALTDRLVTVGWRLRAPLDWILGRLYRIIRQIPVRSIQSDPVTLDLNQAAEAPNVLRSQDIEDPPIISSSNLFLYIVGILALLSLLFAFDFTSSSTAGTYLGRCILGAVGLTLGLIAVGIMFEGEVSLAGLLFLPILLLLVPVSACFSVLGILGFGLGTGLLVFFYEVSVESSPIGTWHTCLLPPMGTGLMYHSQIYENSDALSELYNWISAKKGVHVSLSEVLQLAWRVQKQCKDRMAESSQ